MIHVSTTVRYGGRREYHPIVAGWMATGPAAYGQCMDLINPLLLSRERERERKRGK